MLRVRVHWARTVPAAELAHRMLPAEAERVGNAGRATRSTESTVDDVASSLVLARTVVAQECGVDPRDVTLTRRCPACGSAEHGQPRAVRADRGPVPYVSLTRTRGLVAVAVAPVPVGIDLERNPPGAGHPRERDAPAIEGVALAPGEIQALPRRGRTAAVLRTWTRKEALLKAAGTGLAIDPRLVVLGPATRAPRVVTLPPVLARVTDRAADLADGTGPRPVAGSRHPADPWHLADVDIRPGHLCAIALRPAPGTLVRVSIHEVVLRR